MGTASKKSVARGVGAGQRPSQSRKGVLVPPGFKPASRLVGVKVRDAFRLRLDYGDGYSGTLDFWPYISWGEAMLPLKDPKLFATAHVGSGGASLEWIGPNGEEIDFDAIALRMDLEGLRAPPSRPDAAE
ncbi:MAG: hypothetical protein ABI399_10370 [Bauldia sp.]